MIATLKRFCHADFGVFGKLTLPSGKEFYTVERPWLDNKPFESCIPAGYYICRPRFYNKGGYQAIEITNVIDRDHILFHIANRPEEVAGCIGVGNDVGCVDGEWAVMRSGDAFKEFMAEMGGHEFTIIIS